MSDGPNDALPEVERVQVDPGAMAAFDREWSFTVLASELLREVSSYVCIAAGVLVDRPSWTRDQAVVGGNMVRACKLLSCFLDQTAQECRESSVIFSRLIYETVVAIRYLIANFSPELVQSYLRSSLRHERRLHDTIKTEIEARGGTILPIEERMLASVQHAFEAAGIQINDIDLTDKAPWGRKNTYEKAKAIGLSDAYMAIFSGMSHHVHGSWQDLDEYHLSTNDDGSFCPELGWQRPRPQLISAVGIVVLPAVRDYFSFTSEFLLRTYSDRLHDLEARITQADHAHEMYLIRRHGAA